MINCQENAIIFFSKFMKLTLVVYTLNIQTCILYDTLVWFFSDRPIFDWEYSLIGSQRTQKTNVSIFGQSSEKNIDKDIFDIKNYCHGFLIINRKDNPVPSCSVTGGCFRSECSVGCALRRPQTIPEVASRHVVWSHGIIHSTMKEILTTTWKIYSLRGLFNMSYWSPLNQTWRLNKWRRLRCDFLMSDSVATNKRLPDCRRRFDCKWVKVAKGLLASTPMIHMPFLFYQHPPDQTWDPFL